MKTKLIAALTATAALWSFAQNPVDPYMGDWKGTVKPADGAERTVAVTMIPLGSGKYEAKFLSTLETRVPVFFDIKGIVQRGEFKAIDAVSLDASRAVGTADNGVVFGVSLWSGKFEGGTLAGTIAGKAKGEFSLTQSKRTSPTLGAKPPAGAVVLFDGKSLEAWQSRDGKGAAKWKIVEGDAMQAGGGDITTKENFKDVKLHIEFRTPYMPTATGQGRGNSGVYPQGRYEIQVLDSYGLEGADNECGGIYQIARPKVNMCLPPLDWQTYDVTFKVARFDASGKKTANARITILHNGVTIHEDLELPHVTGGALSNNENEAGPLLLQDHANPVQFRNIWIEKLN
jgi:hypothetical protein